jgi:hypothetical protein
VAQREPDRRTIVGRVRLLRRLHDREGLRAATEAESSGDVRVVSLAECLDGNFAGTATFL